MRCNRPHSSTTTAFIRGVDALERLFYRYSERNPAHFLVVAEFGEVLRADRVRVALGAVQRRHPLLSVHVEDRWDTRLGFYRAGRVDPIELTVHRDPESSWQGIAAGELSRTFDRSRAPLMRASLVQRPASSVLLLTFDHTIADGISALLVLTDLLAVLNGANLVDLPVPQSQEYLISSLLQGVDPLDPSTLPDDPRMHKPNTIRRFDGTPTNVHIAAMTAVDTAKLVERCRAERTTVHAAILTATCRARAAARGEDFVRVLNPINFRALIGVEGDCAPYFQATWTGLAPWDGTPFWEQSRMMTAHLEVARSTPGIRAASLAVQQAIPADAEADDAEDLFSRVCPFDMIVSNLGVQNLNGAGPLRPTAVWGPIVQGQIEGEYVSGITTFEGRLRMVTCGHTVPDSYLKDVTSALADAVE